MYMQIIRGFDSIPNINNTVATVGSYDGVHVGHQILVEHVVKRAKERGGVSIVLTFEPHPRITLGQDLDLKLLTTLDEKVLLLERLGVDYLLVIPFDRDFSRLSHEQFIEHYLIEKLGVEELVVGYNHHFGHNKSGDYGYLTANHPQMTITRVEQQLVETRKVSSTVIRSLLEVGDIGGATQLLGHTYIIMGQSDEKGIVVTDKYKLIPPIGRYPAIVNGKHSEVEVLPEGICCQISNAKIVVEL